MRLQTLIAAAQQLSPQERVDLISAVSRSLQLTYRKEEETTFWEPKSLEEQVQLQGVSAVMDIAELRASFWPAGETADDLIDYIYRQRTEERFN
jgi:hypothetical protein